MKAVILNAGASDRMRTYEPRAMLKVGDKTILDHQFSILRHFGFTQIRTVVGFKQQKIKRNPSIVYIENKNYEHTNNAESFKLGFRPEDKSVILIHGDIVFNQATLALDYSESFLIVDNKQQIKDREVGVVSANNVATFLSYGIKQKWCQIAYFTNQEFDILHDVIYKDVSKKLTFEIINSVIDGGGKFNIHEPEKMKISEIDFAKELKSEKTQNINS